jgi:phosphoribosylaminoimidazole-succinocarboxamide synthase
MVEKELIRANLSNVLVESDYPQLGKKYRGKVRDNYISDDGIRTIISSDRLSAFDRVLTAIPFKGQLLNQMSVFWFEKTKNIWPNHIINVPDPNVVRVKNCKTFPIEMIVRGYITGSAWRDYQAGNDICGIKFPSGLKKNQKIDTVITPTTKAEVGHDMNISREEIIKQGLVPEEQYAKLEEAAIKMFKYGQEYCAKNGLILVDCKFEFGYDEKGNIIVIDEIFTPDASRFWILDTYEKKFNAGQEPDILDKEFFRAWLMSKGFKGDGEPPAISDDVKVELAMRYIQSYEMITGEKFVPDTSMPVKERIKKNLNL